MADKKRKYNSTLDKSIESSRKMNSQDHDHQKRTASVLPVSLLGGFLGSGKTTLLKHILETKHKLGDESSFKCAVIVNDVAELNIDKTLIDQTSFVQSEEVISMENGCVCCTLKSDLVDQIIEIASKQEFDYMIIEASGISEPSEIAKTFAECDDDHDHDAAHGKKPALSDVARLDTCVTLVDAADFFNKLETVIQGSNSETYAKLLVEQVEYSNVVIINKTDLVSEAQIDKIKENISLLNPNAKILTAQQSSIDVNEVVDTKLYNAKDFENILSNVVEVEEVKECCKISVQRGESPCCRRARTIDSGLSTVMLCSKKLPKTRHEARFGITSFIYKARRPFHSERFHKDFIDKYFVFMDDEEAGENEEEEEIVKKSKEKKNNLLEQNGSVHVSIEWDSKNMKVHHQEKGTNSRGVHELDIEQQIQKEKEKDIHSPEGGDESSKGKLEHEEKIILKQQEADEKAQVRAKEFGNILRSKGFLWSSHAHDLMVIYSQASNTLSLSFDEKWKVLEEQAWVGTDEEKALFRKDFVDPWGDRRQELVFIGQDMNSEGIQRALDKCLLTDEEYAMGLDGWKATIGDMFLSGEN